ncbi:type II secretion system F family protein [Nocardioides caldifontis]|uniref:type II secretion system F family protein n=1 Tax=Nocardioides caldifontis TaxID=2588938 RepID=UPI0011DF80DE|nr:type II secretion system F family protein [Nocardioides caldifontis]
MNRTRRTLAASALLCAAPFALVLGGSAPAWAVESTIDHVEGDGEELQVLVSLQGETGGATPDLASVAVTFDGEPLPAEAHVLDDGGREIQRTTVLAMDVSNSMRGDKFAEAKQAAEVFLDTVPADVRVGLVTFAADVVEVQAPTDDHDAVRDALAGLALSRQTRLYDGVTEAVAATGEDGARSVLVLSDGADTSTTAIADVTAAVKGAEVKLDVVALAQSTKNMALLQQLTDAGGGKLLSASDPAALSDVFAQEAEALAQQVLVTVTPTEATSGAEGTLSVSFHVDGTTVTDGAFVQLPQAAPQPEEPTEEVLAAERGPVIPEEWMLAGLAATAVALVVILFLAFGGTRDRKRDAVDRRIEAYTRKGARKLAEAGRAEPASVTQQAVAVAENVLEGQRGLQAALESRLESAGLALRPAEWLLIHAGLTLGLGVVAILLGGGSALFMLVGLLLGAGGPWLFLSLKKSRRLAAFKAQLADTLQLMAGSLSAGLSLAQSVDTVVREGSDPMAAEFRRALIETRLGVEIEEALAGVGERMESVDFEWVVMAIRIQREVGGNLSELLNKVADTIREREYLERQVKTLSAEGRMSVWILGGLPPAFLAYLVAFNPGYVSPMWSSPLGWAMLILMGILLSGGIFWMKRVVKVEV